MGSTASCIRKHAQAASPRTSVRSSRSSVSRNSRTASTDQQPLSTRLWNRTARKLKDVHTLLRGSTGNDEPRVFENQRAPVNGILKEPGIGSGIVRKAENRSGRKVKFGLPRNLYSNEGRFFRSHQREAMEVPPLGLPANIHDPPRGTGSATKDEVSREQRGMVDDSKYPPFTEVVQMFESQCGGEHNMKNAHTSRAQEQHREAKELIGNSAEQDDGSLDTASERSWGKRLPLAFETDPIRLEKIMTRAIRVEMLSDKRQRDEGENKTSGVSENLSPHSDQDGQLGPYLSKSESRPSNPRFIQNGSRWQVAVGEQRGIARLNFEKKCTEEAEPKRAAPQGLLSPKGVTQFIF